MSRFDGPVSHAIGHVMRSYINLDVHYDWAIPKATPISGFDRSAEPLWKANQRLRAALSEAWKLGDQEKRYELAHWYVSVWGGARRNLKTTIEKCVDTDPQIMIAGPLKGVSTWSKILAVQEPEKYQIYDARVAVSLNALNLLGKPGGGCPLFYIPKSQNKTISAFSDWLAKRTPRRSKDFVSYQDYLHILQTIGRKNDLSPQTVEMALFADAELHAAEAMEDIRD